MGEIEVDRLIQREGDIVTVKGLVRVRVKHGHGCVREASDKFLDIADTLSRGSRVSGTVAVPEDKIYNEELQSESARSRNAK